MLDIDVIDMRRLPEAPNQVEAAVSGGGFFIILFYMKARWRPMMALLFSWPTPALNEVNSGQGAW